MNIFRYKCSECSRRIGDKAHEWCQAMYGRDFCYDHEVKVRDKRKKIEVNWGQTTIINDR